MTQIDLFTPGPLTPPLTPGAVAHQGDRYVVACAGCGAAKACPDDIGEATAVCTLRYLGWSSRPDKRWRCPRCAAPRPT